MQHIGEDFVSVREQVEACYVPREGLEVLLDLEGAGVRSEGFAGGGGGVGEVHGAVGEDAAFASAAGDILVSCSGDAPGYIRRGCVCM